MEPNEVEQILKQCEAELLQLSLLQEQGVPAAESFKTAVFRFLWLKLTEPLQKQANFYGKGLDD